MPRGCGRLPWGRCACGPRPAAAQEAGGRGNPEFVGIRVGFAGQYKIGLWTPVTLTLRGGRAALTGRVVASTPDNDSVPCAFSGPEASCMLLPGRESSVMLYVRFGHVATSLHAEFLADGTKVAAKDFETGLDADAEHFLDGLTGRGLIVHVGGARAGIENALQMTRSGSEIRAVVAEVTDLAELPARWQGYEGVDAVVLSTGNAEMFGKLAQENARLQALDDWVRLGGRLVLTVGCTPKRCWARAPRWPASAGQVRPHDHAAPDRGRGNVCPQHDPHPAAQARPAAAVAHAAAERRGGTDRGERGRSAAGDPQFAGLRAGDLPGRRPGPRPLSGWPDRRLLMARLLDLPTGEVAGEQNLTGQTFAIRDLAGQLPSAINRPSGVWLVPFWVVVMLVVVYILLIGPGDYFFLRRFVGRMEWTWLTFPAIVVLFSGRLVLRGLSAQRQPGPPQPGRPAQRRHRRHARAAPAGSTSSARRWTPSTSPCGRARRTASRPADSRRTWPGSARPAKAWGACTARRGLAGGATLWNSGYAISPDSAASTPPRSRSGRPRALWPVGPRPRPAQALTARLVEEDGLPSGTITNRLPFPLTQCTLVFDRWAFKLGTLDPGARRRSTSTRNAWTSETLLTGRRLAFDQKTHAGKSAVNPYDAASRDAPYILQTMMFYQAADGPRYTALANDYQGFVDMSELLRAGRAVLVAAPAGRRPPAPPRCLRDDRPLGNQADSRTTLYRFVLPVTTKKRIGSSAEGVGLRCPRWNPQA